RGCRYPGVSANRFTKPTSADQSLQQDPRGMRMQHVVRLARTCPHDPAVLHRRILVNAMNAAPVIKFFPKRSARGHWALLGLRLLRFLNDGTRSVAGHDPACRPGHDGFILKPKESKVVDALRKIRLDDDVSRNHG